MPLDPVPLVHQPSPEAHEIAVDGGREFPHPRQGPGDGGGTRSHPFDEGVLQGGGEFARGRIAAHAQDVAGVHRQGLPDRDGEGARAVADVEGPGLLVQQNALDPDPVGRSPGSAEDIPDGGQGGRKGIEGGPPFDPDVGDRGDVQAEAADVAPAADLNRADARRPDLGIEQRRGLLGRHRAREPELDRFPFPEQLEAPAVADLVDGADHPSDPDPAAVVATGGELVQGDVDGRREGGRSQGAEFGLGDDGGEIPGSAEAADLVFGFLFQLEGGIERVQVDGVRAALQKRHRKLGVVVGDHPPDPDRITPGRLRPRKRPDPGDPGQQGETLFLGAFDRRGTDPEKDRVDDPGRGACGVREPDQLHFVPGGDRPGEQRLGRQRPGLVPDEQPALGLPGHDGPLDPDAVQRRAFGPCLFDIPDRRHRDFLGIHGGRGEHLDVVLLRDPELQPDRPAGRVGVDGQDPLDPDDGVDQLHGRVPGGIPEPQEGLLLSLVDLQDGVGPLLVGVVNDPFQLHPLPRIHCRVEEGEGKPPGRRKRFGGGGLDPGPPDEGGVCPGRAVPLDFDPVPRFGRRGRVFQLDENAA